MSLNFFVEKGVYVSNGVCCGQQELDPWFQNRLKTFKAYVTQ